MKGMAVKLAFWKKSPVEDDDDSDAINPRPWDALSVPFPIRLKAWWEGYDDCAEYYYLWLELKNYHQTVKERDAALSRRARLSESMGQGAGEEDWAGDLDLEDEAGLWPSERVRLYSQLWSEDILTPGGLSYAVDLTRPLGLDETMMLLELGGRLGTTARQLAREFGVWVTSLEQDQELVTGAANLNAGAGAMAKKASVTRCDPENLDLRENYYHYFYSHLELYKFEDKEGFLRQVHDALREDGEMLFTDYCATTESGSDLYMEWLDEEEETPHPWLERNYKKFFKSELKFDFRVDADESEEHVRQILLGWHRKMKEMQSGNIDPETFTMVEAELEMWMRRVKLLKSGELKFFRFYALPG